MKEGQHSRKTVKMIEPNTLNMRWIRLARLALVLAPTEERMAVIHVPILLPSTRKRTPLLPGSPMDSPAPTMTMMSEVTAELDCTRAVNAAPMRRSKKGLLTPVKKFLNDWESRKMDMESDMTCKPRKTSPSPASTTPMVLIFSFLESISINTPTQANTVTNAIKSKACKEAIWAVMVVPIFAPMMMAVA